MQKHENQPKAKGALRHAAEMSIKGKPATKPPQTEPDCQHLKSELEVHKVELEMQNIGLLERQAEIEAGLEHFSDFFDFSPVGYFDLATDSTIRLVNLTGANLIGLASAELYGRRFQLFVALPDRKAFNDFLDRVFTIPTRHICELTLEKIDLTLMHAHLEATLSRDGKSCRLVVFDITRRKQAEAEKEKLEAQNQQLQKAESLGRMAGAIAHNFNNQLAAVILNLELLQQEVAPSSHHSPSNLGLGLSAALQSARKAANISTQMLVYLGQTGVQREPLDISEACRQSLPLLQAGIPNTLVLKTDMPASGPAIEANANQILQVLTNLLTNASEASSSQQDAIRLTVKPVPAVDIPAANRFPTGWQPQEPAYACLEVGDSGCGMTARDIEKIFDPFFTSKFTGRGLGLSAVLGIVREHGGGITVESEPGRGSVFRVFLPMTAAAVPQKPVPVVTVPEMARHGAVLVVEDDLSLRTVVTRALDIFGFTVFAAVDGVEAVELFGQHRDEIRCVLCDLTMPRLDGWETLIALRKLAPGIPVILSSGYDDATVMEGHHDELPQALLQKPYELKALINLINQVQPELRAEKRRSLRTIPTVAV